MRKELMNNEDEKFDLSSKNIKDFSEVIKLLSEKDIVTIKYLDLSNNLLENINGIETFPYLGFVNLENNKLTDISALRYLFLAKEKLNRKLIRKLNFYPKLDGNPLSENTREYYSLLFYCNEYEWDTYPLIFDKSYWKEYISCRRDGWEEDAILDKVNRSEAGYGIYDDSIYVNNLEKIIDREVGYHEMQERQYYDEKSYIIIDYELKDENLPHDFIIKYLSDEFDEKIRFKAMKMKNLKEDIVFSLARHEDYRVRGIVSTRKSLSVDVLRLLAFDDNENVRTSIAKREALPVEIMQILMNDIKLNIRKIMSKMIKRNLIQDEIKGNFECFIQNSEKKTIQKHDYKVIKFEKTYSPLNDKELLENEITIQVLLDLNDGEIERLGLFFKRNELEIASLCVNPNHFLQPEENFFVLKSYIEGLIDLGIQKSLLESIRLEMESGIPHIGFHHQMRVQLINVLLEISYGLGRNIIKNSLIKHYPKNPKKYVAIFIKRFQEGGYNQEELISRIFQDILVNEELPLNILEQLAEDTNFPFIHELLERKKNQYCIIKGFSKINIHEDDGDICLERRLLLNAVSKRNDLSSKSLLLLSNDKDIYIRNLIAEKKDLPRDVLKKIILQDNVKKSIMDDIFYSFDYMLSILNEKDIKKSDVSHAIINRYYWMIERGEEIPKEIIEKLQFWTAIEGFLDRGSLSAYTKREITKIANLRPSIIKKLASDKDEEIRKIIGTRNELPEEIIEKFLKDKAEAVRISIAQRISLSESMIKTLLKDKSPEVRIKLANRKDLSERFLVKLAKDKNKRVKLSIAKRLDLPEKIIKRLLKDQNYAVRSAMKESKEKKGI